MKKIYGLLDDNQRRIYSFIEDIISDYKAEDITLDTAVNKILLILYNEKEKETDTRGKNQINL